MKPKKPVERTQAWEKPVETAEQVEQGTDLIPGEYITKGGEHHVKNYISKQKEINKERKAKWLRDKGGRELDERRLPPPEYQFKDYGYKHGSRVRYPSEAFRRGFDLIDWSR